MLAGATISTHFRVLSVPLFQVSLSIPKLATNRFASFRVFHSPFKIPPSSLSCFSSSFTAAAGRSRLNLTSPGPMAPSSKAKTVAEYAKSGRSSCKKCSQSIPAKSLRLGLVSRDARGFDLTKWYHMHCFSETLDSVELIAGFDSLQSGDQDALKKLVDECKSSIDKVSNGATEVQKGSKKGRKNPEADEDGLEDEENKVTKKIKPTAKEETRADIVFSISDVMQTYKGATLLPKWKAFQTVIFLETDDGLRDSDKVAAFDFDGCLAKTSVKRVGADAWSLMYPSIPDKLSSLYNDGYKLVIFTNESNIDRWKNKRQVAVDSKIGRLNNFIQHVKVPIQIETIVISHSKCVLPVSCQPQILTIELSAQQFQQFHLQEYYVYRSFYVGDAAGRDDDHSDADLKFAQAVGLKFHVPEDFFGA
ncbi:unnamed protein product [Linum tenue]|uniref:PARP-type domain-containing protein n=1 Tax=Linum tenue TaxID=586396 RepID=A0AAV0JQA2_9ROSI|nr:unnamed protein product [Linum tenue]